MNSILVTGGTGTLGRDVAAELAAHRQGVRIMSRQPTPPDRAYAWAQADLLTGAGLADAVRGIDVIVNCASSPASQTHDTDIVGTQALIDHAKAAGVRHFLHISIVGIDRIDRPYYRTKLAAERMIAESGVPYSILRITQFHSYVERLLQPLSAVTAPELRIPAGAIFQSIASRDAARYLGQYATPQAHGMLEDVGGPEVLTLGAMARTWLDERGDHRPIIDTGAAPNDTTLTPEQAEGFMHSYNKTGNKVDGAKWEAWVGL